MPSPELHFTITVEEPNRIVKTGTTWAELEDALWELYDAELCPFAPDQDDDDEADDDEYDDLDDEFDAVDPEKPGSPPPKHEE